MYKTLWIGSLVIWAVLIQAAPQHWRQDWVDELMRDEWPMEELVVTQSSATPLYDQDYEQSIIKPVVMQPSLPIIPPPLSPLQMQEEQDLERWDQEIIATLETALDKVQQDRPIRSISLEDSTAQLLASYSLWSYLKLALPITFLGLVVLFLRKSSGSPDRSDRTHPPLYKQPFVHHQLPI